MYNIGEFKNLTIKYGSYSSWAIWDYKNEGDVSIIRNNIKNLHSNYIFLALNVSGAGVKDWSNFHGGSIHDRKLKYASNDNKLRGSYITDIFKDIIEPVSSKIKNILTEHIINKNVSLFNQEMKDIKINNDSIFIILGTPKSLISQYFNKYFKQGYKNQITYHYHHSYYGLKDKEWVQSLWKKLNINQDFYSTFQKYKNLT